MEWPYVALIGFCCFIFGAFVIALCAMARCGDCEIIARIWRGGKP